MTAAVLHQRFSTAWLRERFATPVEYEPHTFGDGHVFKPDQPLRPASVLVPLIDRDEGPTVLFTRRTSHLHDHAGQISFPGGRAEPADRTPQDTALRETEEEIGLAAQQVEIIGSIHRYTTVTGYDVTPVVGIVKPPFELRLDTFEVAEAFEVPLAFLLDGRNHQRTTVVHQGRQRQYFAMPYRGYYIWGATAGMLMNFHRFVMAQDR